MIMCIQNLVKLCLLDVKIWRKYQILMSIKGRNAYVNLQKNKQTKKNPAIYNTNVDLVNENVFTKFGLILSIRHSE